MHYLQTIGFLLVLGSILIASNASRVLRSKALSRHRVQDTASDVLFVGDFETGSLSQWNVEQCSNNPPRITTYTASTLPASDAPVPRQGKYAAHFRVLNTDVKPCTTTPNPRAQLSTSLTMFKVGDEAWEAWSIYLPLSFPTMNATCPTCDGGPWLLFQEDYGPPWDGSPSLGWDIGINNKVETFTLNRGAPKFDSAWNIPLVRGKWMDFLVHKKFHSNPAIGFIEAWVNGEQIKFLPCNGCTRLMTSTLHPTMASVAFFINLYRAHNMWPVAEAYYDAVRLGKTRASVDLFYSGATTVAPTVAPTKPAVKTTTTVAPTTATTTKAASITSTKPVVTTTVAPKAVTTTTKAATTTPATTSQSKPVLTAVTAKWNPYWFQVKFSPEVKRAQVTYVDKKGVTRTVVMLQRSYGWTGSCLAAIANPQTVTFVADGTYTYKVQYPTGVEVK